MEYQIIEYNQTAAAKNAEERRIEAARREAGHGLE